MGRSNHDDEISFTEAQLLNEAIAHWHPARPRRWLARYGNLAGMPISAASIRYRDLRREALRLTARSREPGQGDCLPEVFYAVGE